MYLIIFLLCIAFSNAFRSSLSSRQLHVKSPLAFPRQQSIIHTKSSSLQFTTQPIDGEDAAVFSLEKQSLQSWGVFTAAVAAVLSFLFYVWIYEFGPHLGDQFKDLMEGIAGQDSTLTITYMLLFFAFAHSGLASLRPLGEQVRTKKHYEYSVI